MQGTPPEMMQPPYGQPAPMQPGTTAAPPKPKPTNGAIIALVIIGALMLMVGILVLQARLLIKAPTSGPDYQNWLDLMRYMAFVGQLLVDIGVFFIILVGPYAAVNRADISDRVRRALISMSSTIGVAWLVVMLVFANYIAAHP